MEWINLAQYRAVRNFGLHYFRRVASEDILLSSDLVVDRDRHGYEASAVKTVFARLWLANPWEITTFSEMGRRVHETI